MGGLSMDSFYGAGFGIVWIVVLILGILALLMPLYIYQIRNLLLKQNRKLDLIHEALLKLR